MLNDNKTNTIGTNADGQKFYFMISLSEYFEPYGIVYAKSENDAARKIVAQTNYKSLNSFIRHMDEDELGLYIIPEHEFIKRGFDINNYDNSYDWPEYIDACYSDGYECGTNWMTKSSSIKNNDDPFDQF